MRISKFHNLHQYDFPKVKPKGGPLNKGILAAWRRSRRGEEYYGAGRATEKRSEDG